MLRSGWRRLARAAIGLYPRAWRERYGDEMLELLDSVPSSPGVTADVVSGALHEHGVYRAAARLGRFTWTIVRAWALMLVCISIGWIAFVIAFAPVGSTWYGFDQSAWTLERLSDIRRVIIPSTSFYFAPSLAFSLPVLVALFLLRAGRRPWLARTVFVGAFLAFSIWWDGFLVLSSWSLNGLWPEHVGMIVGGWLIAVRLFQRKARASMSTPLLESSDDPNAAVRPSPPRALLRTHTSLT